MSGIMQQLRRVTAPGRSDGQLLEGYLTARDESAFAALVGRHGPMVLGVCRRVLGDEHDAEEAFQATFLVLARKAGSVAVPRLLAHWLYRVAHQAALKARAVRDRRRRRERQVETLPEPATAPAATWDDVRPLIDEELGRLPERYRLALVLCDLSGMTRREAADQLGWPEGSLSSRLSRARALLARRLTRRGVTLSAAALAAAVSASATAAVRAPLACATSRAALGLTVAAAGGISAGVATLTTEVLKDMLLLKLKAAARAFLLLVSLAGCAAGVFAYLAAAAESVPGPTDAPPQPAREKSVKPAKLPDADRDLNRFIERVLKAHGGEANLRRLKTFVLTTRQPPLDGAGKASVTAQFVTLPDRYRMEFSTPGDAARHINILLGPDGVQRWRRHPDGRVEPIRLGGLDLPREYWLDHIEFLGPRAVLRLTDPDHRRTLLGETKVDGRAAVGVALTKEVPLLRLSLKMFFDKETGRLVREENVLQHAAARYSDYRTVGGVLVAGETIRLGEGKVVGRSELVEFRAVEKLDPALFRAPAPPAGKAAAADPPGP
jgi:RNA polymerase sigma factor (sigma-70 family)